MKSFFLSLGSNIDPISNLNSAINHLKNIGIEISCSNFYKSPSEGFEGEDFINCALGIKSKLDFDDLNKELIEFYKIIQNEPIKFYKVIKKIIKKYNLTDNKEQFYYSMRGLYNNIKINNIKKSALFLFLNKTGFRGLFRESNKGFNVPYGNYNNPEIINYDNLLNFSNLIKNVIFINDSFENSLIKIKKNDFVYLDPPYYPENKISFTNYTNEGFDLETHTKLFNICLKMKNKFIISNSDTEFVKQFFKNYKINKIKVKRRINPDNPNSFTNELIIKNY